MPSDECYASCHALTGHVCAVGAASVHSLHPCHSGCLSVQLPLSQCSRVTSRPASAPVHQQVCGRKASREATGQEVKKGSQVKINPRPTLQGRALRPASSLGKLLPSPRFQHKAWGRGGVSVAWCPSAPSLNPSPGSGSLGLDPTPNRSHLSEVAWAVPAFPFPVPCRASMSNSG